MGQPKQDRPLFEGGPLMSQVQSWKKQFGAVDSEGNVIQEGEIYLTQIGEDRFVWRPLNRYEYKEILALPNTDPLQREEIICQTCVLWPEGYNYEMMARGKAGIPALLAEQIMEASGFVNQLTPPTRL